MKRAYHWHNLNGVAEIKEVKSKWCTKCKTYHPREFFGIDLERTDGLSNKCSKRKREIYENSKRMEK